jgi:aspartyl/glutamyl-tRNA(Asn/Gln) amidotransferase subunit B (EC 6.3.5.-)
MTASALAQDDLAAVIGLEVHIQLETDTKIFCGCSTTAEADESPNSRTCPVCLGLPGALPVINEEAVRAAVKVGKALSAEIPEQTQFHRKNYYYPDLPKTSKSPSMMPQSARMVISKLTWLIAAVKSQFAEHI